MKNEALALASVYGDWGRKRNEVRSEREEVTTM
jgi:hypothetical protein